MAADRAAGATCATGMAQAAPTPPAPRPAPTLGCSVDRFELVQACTDRLSTEQFSPVGMSSGYFRMRFDFAGFAPHVLDAMGIDGQKPLVVHLHCFQERVVGASAWTTTVGLGDGRPVTGMLQNISSARLIYQVQRIIKNYTEAELPTSNPKRLRRFWLDLHNRIAQRLTHMGDHCVVCDAPQSTPGIKPVPCADPVCTFAYDNLGYGSCLDMLERQPDLADFLIAASAAASQMPSARRDLVFDDVPATFRTGQAQHGKVGPVDWNLLSRAFAALPSVGTMAAAENLRDVLPAACVIEGTRVPLPAIELLRWVFQSVRAHIMPLAPAERFAAMATQQQFLLCASHPKHEATFAEAKAKHGSYFAFHGSGFFNWHGILRQSLKNASGTALQSSGAACGSGIYMALDSGVSAGYSGSNGRHSSWSHSALGEHPKCLALCEVIKGAERSRHGYRVVPDATQVVTRYLFVYPSEHAIPRVDVAALEPICHQRMRSQEQSAQAFAAVRAAAADAARASEAALARLRVEPARPELVCPAYSTDDDDDGSTQETFSDAQNSDSEDYDYAPMAPAPKETPAASSVQLQRLANMAASGGAQKRLIKELRELANKGLTESAGPGGTYQVYILDPDTSVLHWEAKIWMDPSTSLGKDLATLAQNGGHGYVTLGLDFPQDYPLAPPAVWVKGPRFEVRRGFVSRGAVCMEMLALTDNGWRPQYTIENILSVLRLKWHEPEAAGKLADTQRNSFYTKEESLAGWKNALATHREWQQ